MISLSYSCSKCEYSTGVLNDAQEHSNSTQHHIKVQGFLTPTTTPVADLDSLRQNAAVKRMRESAILRLARDKGLLGK